MFIANEPSPRDTHSRNPSCEEPQASSITILARYSNSSISTPTIRHRPQLSCTSQSFPRSQTQLQSQWTPAFISTIAFGVTMFILAVVGLAMQISNSQTSRVQHFNFHLPAGEYFSHLFRRTVDVDRGQDQKNSKLASGASIRLETSSSGIQVERHT